MENVMAARPGKPGRLFVGLLSTMVSVVVLLVGPETAGAAVRQLTPEGPPFYARIVTDVAGTEDVSAVVFYRSPTCIPPDFNLLQFFDVPGAFGCSVNVDGFVIWKNGPPPIDQAPIQQELFEVGAVPVWFVATSELQDAIADGVLTIGELAGLPSLVTGSATSFHETLHPSEAAVRPMIQINARGTLSDGRTFQLHGVCACDRATGHVRISFR